MLRQAFRKNAELILKKIDTGAIDLKSEPPGIKQGTIADRPNNIELGKGGDSSEPKPKGKCCG